MKNLDRDLWWEAREKTARDQALARTFNPLVYKVMSFAGAPARPTFRGLAGDLGRANAALAIDLNKYRPDRDLKKFVDAGVDIIILRIGGPTRWVQGSWGYEIDKTYKPYLEQCDALGVMDRTIGYIVHNPFEEWSVNGSTGETMHTELLDEWTSGGYMTKAFSYDHEVAKCWTSTGREILCTAPNLVTSLAENTLNTYKKFRRMVSIYTARWFTNANGPVNHQTYFDNINRSEADGGPGKQRPMWWAWYPQNYTKIYTNLQDSLTDLLVPSTSQTASLLQQGSYSLADLWQFTSSLKLAGDVDNSGVDASVSLLSLQECFAAFGLVSGTTPPPKPPTPPNGEYVTQAVFDAHVASGTAHQHTHQIGEPQ